MEMSRTMVIWRILNQHVKNGGNLENFKWKCKKLWYFGEFYMRMSKMMVLWRILYGHVKNMVIWKKKKNYGNLENFKKKCQE